MACIVFTQRMYMYKTLCSYIVYLCCCDRAQVSSILVTVGYPPLRGGLYMYIHFFYEVLYIVYQQLWHTLSLIIIIIIVHTNFNLHNYYRLLQLILRILIVACSNAHQRTLRVLGGGGSSFFILQLRGKLWPTKLIILITPPHSVV